MSKLSKFLLSTAAVATVASGLTTAGLTAANAADAPTLRVSTQRASYTDTSGNVWSADSGFEGGWQNANVTTAPIAGTTDAKLYQSEHYGMKGWSAKVPNGTYDVTLKTAETYWTQKGARVFSVTAEGRSVVSNLDIFAEVGKNRALDKKFTVTYRFSSLPPRPRERNLWPADDNENMARLADGGEVVPRTFYSSILLS